ncbi:DUF7710 domain-containing protein [Methylosinus sporium]|uniref:DUF7710 domain-containing protein n=1 Tax=Methylosinus sporium TaxID=428 RepID=UPI001AEE87A0|nr:hypothetical protein [Methylosinus sporium]
MTSEHSPDNKIVDVWVFNGNSSRFPSAIFVSKDKAMQWASEKGLAGTLTKYPVDIPLYDYAIENGWFKPKSEKHCSSEFIGNFSSASQDHIHIGSEDPSC